MAYQTYITPVNTFHMLPVDPAIPDKYNSGNIDVSWYKELLRYWQQTPDYLQKIRRGNHFRFMVDVSSYDTASLDIIDCYGAVVLNIPLTSHNDTIPGNLDTDGDQMDAQVYKLPDLSAITADGTYYLVFTIHYDGDHIQAYISEPFSLKDRHENTIMLEYRHKYNTNTYAFFEQLPTIFNFLVEAIVTSLDPQVDTVSFDDQIKDFSVIDSQAFLAAKLKIGVNGEGVPDWVFLKLTEILRCSDVAYDGKFWKRSGTSWNKVQVGDDDVYPLFGGVTDLREPEWAKKYRFGTGQVNIYTPPGTYPYAVANMVIGRAGGTLVNVFSNAYDAVRINNLSEETAYIAAQNAVIADFEFLGTITKVGGIVKYINGPGENYNFAYCLMMPKNFSYQVDASNGGVSSDFSFSDGPVIIDWADGHMSFGIAPVGPEITIHHTYAGTLNYGVTVFHDDTLKVIDVYEPQFNGLNGTFPLDVESLLIYGSVSGIGTFGFNIFLPLTSLNTLLLQIGITSVTNLSPNPFGNIKFIYLNGNNISSSDVSSIIISVKDAVIASGITGGKLYLHNQSPAAPPSAGAIIAKGILQSAYGWIVQHD